MSEGIKETQKIPRIPIKGTSANASRGPATAPIWSIELCVPKAFPACDLATESLIRASRGEVRAPLPALSIVLIASACPQEEVTAKRGLATDERL